MYLIDKTFLKPTKRARILAILENLSSCERISQAEIGLRSGLSGAMVNKYLKELISDRYIEIEPVDGKSLCYKLTVEGEKLRRRLLGCYCAEIVQIYSGLKQMIRNKLARLIDHNVNTLVLFGASETCEVTLSVLHGTDCRVVAIVDNDMDKHGKNFHGYIISSPGVLEQLSFQAIVITSFGRQEEIYKQVFPLAQKKKFQVVRL